MKKMLISLQKIFIYAKQHEIKILLLFSSLISIFFISFYYQKGLTLSYGDAESHLNIAKRVIDSITPGMAQLGGIWLPLPHLLMIPFIMPDALWRTGVGGAIVSGICFVISSIFIYKSTYLFTKNKTASLISFLLFVCNTNILYMQSTPMSELPLIVFFTLSVYYYFVFLTEDKNVLALIGAGFFGFCASLSRYDGWFLVGFELIGLIIFYFPKGLKNHLLEGKAILFSTIGFFGVVLWLLWDKLILGDAFYFTNSPFSAKSQQQGWMAKGELPAYKNIGESVLYYSLTSLENIGIILFFLALAGFIIFLLDKRIKQRFIVTLLLIVPFIFYVATLYLGESVIFIPTLTPATYQWRLFNVRYGMMMVPTAAIFFGYLFYKVPTILKGVLILLFFLQTTFFVTGINSTVTLDDGTHGLSASSHPDAQRWIRTHYDGGYVLLDDYARTISIARSNLPIQKVIYIGNKPYWQDSLEHPEKYVTWVILQKGDAVWSSIYDNPVKQASLYKYFQKTYTSPTILIFKRNTHMSNAVAFSSP